jgi:hypothetical protein
VIELLGLLDLLCVLCRGCHLVIDEYGAVPLRLFIKRVLHLTIVGGEVTLLGLVGFTLHS